MKNFVGYHGASGVRADKILIQNFTIDPKKTGWLGTGIYFFEGNQELAKYWAGFRWGTVPTKVLSCEICVPSKEVFDVTDSNGEDAKKFHETKEEFILLLGDHKVNAFAKNGEDSDGKIFNMICAREGYVMVRVNTYTYTEMARKYCIPSRISNGTELCLRNNSYIKERKIV